MIRYESDTFTYDWGLVTDLAKRNISRMCGSWVNILVSADIRKKRDFVDGIYSLYMGLGIVPLFMAGDKYFFTMNQIKRETGIELDLWNTKI